MFKTLQRGRVLLLVEEVQRFQIAPQARLHAIRCRELARLRKKRIRFPEFPEVGLLERLIDQILAPPVCSCRRFIRGMLCQCIEKLRSFGIVAAVVATIAFGKGKVGIEGAGLDAGKSSRIVDRGGNYGHLTWNDPVCDQALQRKRERRVICRKALGYPQHIAAP